MKKVGLIFLVLVITIPVFAKGVFSKVTIEAPVLVEPIEVTDTQQLEALGMMELMDVFSDVEVNPADLGTGYALTRYGFMGTEYVPFDQVIYYPGESGQSAHIFYVGIVNGSSEYDGRWFEANAAGDAMMQQILAEHGIILAQETSAPVIGLLNWIETAISSIQAR